MADIFDLFRQIAKKPESEKEPISYLIVGLGNPGEKYARTRHNTGFLMLDYLSQYWGDVRIDKLKFHALVGEARRNGVRVLLMKPQTLMNASGAAVGEAAAFYRIPPERVLVISDDITQAPGKIRIRKKGSAGGHNGLKDIIAHLSSEDFPRIRIGIGEKPHPDYDLAAWVLSEFSREDQEKLFAAFGCVAKGIDLYLSGRADDAIALCNSFVAEAK